MCSQAHELPEELLVWWEWGREKNKPFGTQWAIVR